MPVSKTHARPRKNMPSRTDFGPEERVSTKAGHRKQVSGGERVIKKHGGAVKRDKRKCQENAARRSTTTLKKKKKKKITRSWYASH